MKILSSYLTPVLAAILALAGPSMVRAQAYQNVAPVQPVVPAAPAVQPPVVPVSVGNDADQIILPDLKGIRLVPKLSDAGATMGVVSDVPLADGAIPLLQPFVGKPLTLRGLAKMNAILTGYYRGLGHPFVTIAAPPQDVSGGMVSIVISEYRVGQVSVLKNHWFAATGIRDAVRLKPGDTIDAQRLQADMTWLNDNPYRRVDLVARPGLMPGTTDLDLVTHDRRPLSAYIAYANDGSTATGIDRYKLGLLWGNVFGTGQQFGYQLTTSRDAIGGHAARPDGSTGASFIANAANLDIQLPWRHKLEIFGLTEQDRPNIGPDFAGKGHSSQLSVRYVIPLPGMLGVTHDLRLGYDVKTTNNNLDFGGTSVSQQDVEIDQFSLTYQGTVTGEQSATTITNMLVASPGKLSSRNHDADFQPGLDHSGVVGATAAYMYDRLDLSYTRNLPKGYSWLVRATAQVASVNLLPSEQLSIGGFDTVRGYREYVAGGAQGVLLSGELRTPVKAVGTSGSLQGDAFVDYGRVSDVETQPGNPSSVTRSSVGIGMRYNFRQNLSLRVEVGVPFEHGPELHDEKTYANVSLSVGF